MNEDPFLIRSVGLELYPRRGNWKRRPSDVMNALARAAYADGSRPAIPPSASAWYQRGGVGVISSWQMAEAPDGSGDVIPQWLVSVSERGKRPSPRSVQRVRIDFAIEEGDVDNHHPGQAVHLWMPVEPERRRACHCKEGEALVRDLDGYEWSNDPKTCRGCEFERLFGRPCPLHRTEEVRT